MDAISVLARIFHSASTLATFSRYSAAVNVKDLAARPLFPRTQNETKVYRSSGSLWKRFSLIRSKTVGVLDRSVPGISYLDRTYQIVRPKSC